MNCLGIESTAHTFGIGIVTDKGKVLANAWDMYKPPVAWAAMLPAREWYLFMKYFQETPDQVFYKLAPVKE